MRGTNTVSFANLDGCGGGDLNTTGATVEDPQAATGTPSPNQTRPGHSGIEAEGDEFRPTRPTAIGTVTGRIPVAVGRDLLPERCRWSAARRLRQTLGLAMPFAAS
jgi:hypothetical protein